jgi:predicted nucleic acid-binding Zn ribbon protein
MAWDALEFEINAEFASLVADNGTEDELYRRYKSNSARDTLRKRAARAAAPPKQTASKCEACGTAITLAANGRPARFCSGRCRVAQHRSKRRNETVSAIVHETCSHPEARDYEAPEPEDRNA